MIDRDVISLSMDTITACINTGDYEGAMHQGCELLQQLSQKMCDKYKHMQEALANMVAITDAAKEKLSATVTPV